MEPPVRSNQELGKALKEGKNEIVIEGALSEKVLRIRATGTIAWVVARGAIGLAVVVVTSSVGAPAGVVPAAGAVAILGAPATMAAIAIAAAAGDVAALNTLRSYRVVSQEKDRLVLASATGR